jgi:hypothetical protein
VQGDEPPLWDTTQHLLDLYEVLKTKITFPDDPKAILEDPVFRQDKVLLNNILREFMTPTLIINRPDGNSFKKDTLESIYEFGKKNIEVQQKLGVGSWHVKASFTTSNRGVKRSKKLVSVPNDAIAVFNRWGLHNVNQCLFQKTFCNSVVSLINEYL